MLNRVLLIGNLTRDPELRYTPSGKARATFGLAVQRGFGKQSEERSDDVDFVNIVAWEKQAEFAHTYLNKGRQVLVEGRLQVRSFTGQDGVKRTVTDVVAERITFVGPRPQGEAAARPAPAEAPVPEEEATGGEPDVLGDLE